MFTRRVSSLLTTLFLLCGLVVTAHATLIDNGDGTVTETRIDGSRLMWLQDAHAAKTTGYDSDGYMSWYQAQDWIAYLNNNNYLGHSDWRLPQTSPVNGSTYDYNFSYDGSTDYGDNISAPGSVYPGSTGSEMAYMFYYELGNLGYWDTSGVSPQPGWGPTNTGPFSNLQSTYYWSGTEYAPNTINTWIFSFGTGNQTINPKSSTLKAWAVRPAAVPEPGSVFLLGTGLSGLAVFRKMRKRLHG